MRNRGIVLCAVLCLFLPRPLSGKERTLNGEVLLVGEHDDPTPAVGVDVTIKETGDTVRTKAQGLFRIFLPDAFKPGEKVTLSVDKKGWVIQYPLDGETPIRADLEKHVEKVRLLPAGSKKLWSADRFEKFIEDVAAKAREQVKPKGKPEEVDFSRYIKDLAAKYGFTPQQAKAEIDKWVAEVEKTQHDFHKLGLAAYAKKNFAEASKLFTESAETKANRLRALSEEQETLTEETARDFRLAGDAHYNNYVFDKALAAYERALRYVSREKTPRLWASAVTEIGLANWEIGIRTEGPAVHQHLSVAVATYRQALEVYTRKELPQQWATTQNNLGNALSEQGIRTGGEEGRRLLAEAVTTYQQALEVRTRKELPQDWAMTQNNLGNALQDQGTRTEGAEGRRLLAEAVTTYQQALEVRTRKELPQQWAMTQNNLGNALQDQGTRTEGEEGRRLLAEAVTAYQQALEVYTRKELPQQWATTQNDLGNALQQQGIRTGGEEGRRLLSEAFTAYGRALEVRIRAQLPQEWATTQSSLAEAYVYLEDWSNAAASYANVLRVYPDDAKTYGVAISLYHEKMFAFSEAFALNQQWVARHPEDLSAQANFAEAHFTTRRFTEAATRLAALLGNTSLEPDARIALQTLEIATLLVLNKPELIPSKVEALRGNIATQPEHFKLDRTFDGTKHFITQNESLVPYRAWLLDLFAAVAEKDRNTMLAALDAARANFLAAVKN